VQNLEKARLISPEDAKALHFYGDNANTTATGHVSLLPLEMLEYVLRVGMIVLGHDHQGRLVAYHHGLLPPCDIGRLPQFSPDDVEPYPGYEDAVRELQKCFQSTWTVWRTSVTREKEDSGIALALKYVALVAAAHRGCTHATCNVATFNGRSDGMNTRIGFHRCGWRRQRQRLWLYGTEFDARWNVFFADIPTVLRNLVPRLVDRKFDICLLNESATQLAAG
jgi:hypothetical protein